MNPEYPIYIISKGRWESRLTSKYLDKCNIPYHIVVEPQEYEHYANVIDPDKIYTLPFSNLGQGSIPARNWVWEHALSLGAKRHWILDDNIRAFYRLTNHMKHYITSGTIFKAAEDFVDRYTNVALSGFEYAMFRPMKEKSRPFTINRRVYSCILVQNDIPYRWRGRFNEDTDLSLRVLKDKWCTILFYTFLAEKVASMKMGGGNTDTVYKDTDNRREFVESLIQQHTDVVTMQWKYGRYHHKVDYSPFKHNRLIKRDDLVLENKVNNYGMKLVNLQDSDLDI